MQTIELQRIEINNYDWVPYKAFFTLKEAAELKGINYKTMMNKPYLKPCKGENFKIVGGRKVYDRDTIIKWLSLVDKDILSSSE